MARTIGILIGLFFFTATTVAQTPQQLMLLGDEAYTTANYHSAVVYYESALSLDNGLAIPIQLAHAYRHLSNYSSAESVYLNVWNNGTSEFPESGFWAAMMMKSNGKYAEAQKLFLQYFEKQPSVSGLASALRASLEINFCDSAISLLKKPLDIHIRNFSEINTPWSEFNPVLLGDSLFVYSTLTPLITTENPLIASGDYLSYIQIARWGSAGLEKPIPFSGNINSKDVHTANITFTEDGSKVYFNRCSYSDYKLRCDIWASELNNGQWQKPHKLDESLNSSTYTSTQPCVVRDIVSGNELLYFSSDRPGGMGGLDIWFCIIKDGKPQTPVNLGSIINTPGDEITPFYNSENGILYFSSDWHYGLGGFDVFSSKGSMSAWETPKNVGFPVNSGANDFYFITGKEGESFLTSNRAGSQTFREQTCCNDIYIITNFRTHQANIAEVPDTIETSIKDDILELLPLSLYFDNDHPDPRSTSSTTTLTYKQTWEQYIQQKQKFIDEYSKDLEDFAMYYAMTEMEDFFDNYVESGFRKLEILADFVYQDLKAGSNVTLKVKGFTSPLTSAEYNIVLAKRRISSLINYFREWNNGILIPYMEMTAENGASFRIIEEPSGEALSNPYVSDNPHDRKKSVYSKSASLERRIQILIYESDFKKYVNIDENNPVIFIPDNLISLKNLVGLKDPEIEVTISNPGKVPLKIFGIDVSDDQLYILSSPDIVNPGESVVIKVQINGILETYYTEHIIIRTNSAEERSVIHLSTLAGEK